MNNLMRHCLALAAIFFLAWHACVQEAVAQTGGKPVAAKQERRVALVIGNGTYAVTPLANPVNDAADIASRLRSLGFDVIERTNLKTSQIGRTLREFRTHLSAGSVAMVFFAGHGLQIKGENYLLSVDADIAGEEDVPYQSLGVRQLLELLDEAKTSLNLVFLDACRNNPYSRRFRTTSTGLAKVAAPSGTLISFATRPGGYAIDGEGRNGLYTKHLLAVMSVPGLPIEQAMKRLMAGVRSDSKGEQEPWLEGGIEGDFYFIPPRLSEESSRNRDIDRVVEDALKRSSEQAARERAELQARMEQLIRETLGRQNPQAESSRQDLNKESPPPTHQPSNTALSANDSRYEWEYVANDELFGKKGKLLVRDKAVTPQGIQGELVWNNRFFDERLLTGALTVFGAPNESEFVFSPFWNGDIPEGKVVTLEGDRGIWARPDVEFRIAKLQVMGREQVTVPAGSFEALRIRGYMYTKVTMGGRTGGATTGTVDVWYSTKLHRLIKQHAQLDATAIRFNESIELNAIRSGAP